MTRMDIPQPAPNRGIYANRTLNLRSIRAIGYDMDYTLVHYRVAEWEERAFEHARSRLHEAGWPVGDLVFDPTQVIRGLAIDLELGNLLKATRFGYVINAAHGTRFLDYDEIRSTYAATFVDLAEPRFEFMNTLFSLSEASLYAQLVDLLDSGKLPGVGYSEVYEAVRGAINDSHQEDQLKGEILADRGRFIDLDPDGPLALQDQRAAGKQLMLITNATWAYTREIMAYAFDRYLPEGETWRDLFDTVIVSAAKPSFFMEANSLYRVVDEDAALLHPHLGTIEPGGVFFGGNAGVVEKSLGLSGDQILYVGDHLFGDVHISKAYLRWRTALILRELESEVAALIDFLPDQEKLEELMASKTDLEAELGALRLAVQREREGYAPPAVQLEDGAAAVDRVRQELADLDDQIAPLAREAGRLRHAAWGPLMRAGVDKSLFARQVERYADVYTSRVSNLLYPGPFALLRAGRLDLPHDPHAPHGVH
jgi:HAD superfamily 5'-nucleotidase-like hydrolase